MIGLDRNDWCRRFSSALAGVAWSAQPRMAPDFPRGQRIICTSSDGELDLDDITNFTTFVQRARRRPDWRSLFLRALLDADDGRIGDVCAVLRSHPVISASLDPSDDFIAIQDPMGGGVAAKLSYFVDRLVKLSFLIGADGVAKDLDRLLSEGAAQELRGCQITLFPGLHIEQQVAIDEGLFLAPYEVVATQYGPDPDLEDVTDNFPHPIHPQEYELLRKEPTRVTALVREFEWGPPIDEPGISSPPPRIKSLYGSTSMDASELIDEVNTIRDILVVATGVHQWAWTSYVVLEGWLTDLFREYKRPSLRNYHRDGFSFWMHNDPPEGRIEIFQRMMQQRQSYSGEKKQLDYAASRIAASYSRSGRFEVVDSIADIAIALEAMYGLDAPEITYKLRTRAAFLLGSGLEDRREVFDRVNRLYRARSRIVHGSLTSGQQSVALVTDRDEGRDIAKRTLLALLDRGRVPDWDNFILSVGIDDDGAEQS